MIPSQAIPLSILLSYFVTEATDAMKFSEDFMNISPHPVSFAKMYKCLVEEAG
jgi:hypothetical protein